jgi:hypothetical protein
VAISWTSRRGTWGERRPASIPCAVIARRGSNRRTHRLRRPPTPASRLAPARRGSGEHREGETSGQGGEETEHGWAAIGPRSPARERCWPEPGRRLRGLASSRDTCPHPQSRGCHHRWRHLVELGHAGAAGEHSCAQTWPLSVEFQTVVCRCGTGTERRILALRITKGGRARTGREARCSLHRLGGPGRPPRHPS